THKYFQTQTFKSTYLKKREQTKLDIQLKYKCMNIKTVINYFCIANVLNRIMTKILNTPMFSLSLEYVIKIILKIN
ncbi:TPA: hypothetical protein ACMV9B_003863, partial [Clostridioides difficile]